MRSMSAVARLEKSNSPSVGLLASMPSMRNERLVGLGAADADLREVPDAAALAHLDAGQVAQRIRRVADLAVLESLRVMTVTAVPI